MEVPLYQRKNVSLSDCLALYQGPVLTYSCLFENGNCFLRFQKKKKSAFTRCVLEWFLPVQKKTQQRLKPVPALMGTCALTGIHHRDVIVFHEPPFPSIHTSTAKRRRQKSLLWRAFLKTHVFGDRFYRIRVNGRPNWREKILFQTKTYMWTGPKLPCCFSCVFLKKIQTPRSRIIKKAFPVDMHAAVRPTKPETSMA